MKYLIFFLISTTILSAQQCEYISYHSLVDEANEAYGNTFYEKAEKGLKEAFSIVDFPLGEDLFLALQIAQKQHNTKWAETIAIQLAKGGVPLRFFKKFKFMDWYTDFEANFSEYSRFYQENFEPESRLLFKELLESDRNFNERYHQWRTGEIKLSLKELISGAKKVNEEFQNFILKYGFPYEQTLGYNYNYIKNNIAYYNVDVLLIHSYQRGILLFENEIYEIICQGGLHPNYEEILKNIRGFGDSTGIEQEMKIRYAKFQGN